MEFDWETFLLDAVLVRREVALERLVLLLHRFQLEDLAVLEVLKLRVVFDLILDACLDVVLSFCRQLGFHALNHGFLMN